MRKLWQQDVLRYLTNRNQKAGVEDPGLPFGLRLPLKIVRAELDLGGDNARLSSFINRRKNSPYFVPFDGETAFDRLIAPLITSGDINPQIALKNFHEFLWAEGIEDTWKDFTDYRECIIAAFDEGFANRSVIEVQTSPKLHGQRFPLKPSFTGREEDLDRMEEILAGDGVLILSGTGGIGKTTLAEEYAHRHAEDYNAVQMITAQPGVTSFRELLMAVRFDESDSESRKTPEERLTDLLTLDESSLLIFNNIDQELDDFGLFKELLRDSRAQIIITTRMNGAFPEGAELSVGALHQDEQLQLLSQSLGRKLEPDECPAAAEICARTGGHTLIIQLLGRAMGLSSSDCHGILSRMEGLRGFSALETEARVQKDDFNRTDRILHFVQALLFDLTPLSAEEQDLMRFFTLLPLDGISRSLLVSDPFAIDPEDLADLEKHGWLTRETETDTVRMHPIIREAVLAELPVDSDTCTPFLAMLDQALWEPEISPVLTDLLRLASNAIEILFLNDDLRSLLVSERIDPLYEQLYEAVQGASLWKHWQEELDARSREPELLPETVKTLRMYALFCEYCTILDRARLSSGAGPSSAWFPDPDSALEAITVDGIAERFNEVISEFLTFFGELKAESFSEEDLRTFEETPEAFGQTALTLVGAELTDYLQEAGLMVSPDSDPDAIPHVFSLLSREDMRTLESISQPAFGSFLATALEAFAAMQAFLPFTVSPAVFALTCLFVLLRTGASQLGSFEEVTAARGWRFPALTYLPEKFDEKPEFIYEEELWGRPAVSLSYKKRKAALLITMTRPNREYEADEFDLFSSDIIEKTDQRLLRSAQTGKRGGSDVQIDEGPWRIRIRGFHGVSEKEAVRIARGITVPEEDPLSETKETAGSSEVQLQG